MLSCLTARLAAGVLLLLIVPLAVLVTGWQWSPGGAEAFLLPMFWLTETASSPWGAITSVILAIWFIGRLSLSLASSYSDDSSAGGNYRWRAGDKISR